MQYQQEDILTESTDKLLRTAKKKASRLQDITSVFAKLEESDSIQRLTTLIREIFYKEQVFAYEELSKIAQNHPDKHIKLNLPLQFSQNAMLFKVNFEAITSIIINEVCDKMASEFERNFTIAAGLSGPGTGTSLLDHNLHQNNGDSNYDISERQSQAPDSNRVVDLSKLKIANSQLVGSDTASISATPKRSLHTQSANQSGFGQNDTWIRQSMRERNNSQSYENSSKANSKIENIPMTQTQARRMSSASSTNKSQSILDIKKNSEKKMTDLIISLTQSKLNLSTTPFSERPIVKNPQITNFARTPRKLLDRELSQSPGPLDYQVERAESAISKKSPRTTFGNSPRRMDEYTRINTGATSPGPQYDTSQKAIYKPMKKTLQQQQ